jgi:hypothetical protein
MNDGATHNVVLYNETLKHYVTGYNIPDSVELVMRLDKLQSLVFQMKTQTNGETILTFDGGDHIVVDVPDENASCSFVTQIISGIPKDPTGLKTPTTYKVESTTSGGELKFNNPVYISSTPIAGEKHYWAHCNVDVTSNSGVFLVGTDDSTKKDIYRIYQVRDHMCNDSNTDCDYEMLASSASAVCPYNYFNNQKGLCVPRDLFKECARLGQKPITGQDCCANLFQNSNNVCVSCLKNGESVDTDQKCCSGARNDDDECTACVSDKDCDSESHMCHSDGVCRSFPERGDETDPCSSNNDCKKNLACNNMTGKCQAKECDYNGKTCDNSEKCQNYFCIETCKPPGTSCGASSECCDSDFCAPLQKKCRKKSYMLLYIGIGVVTLIAIVALVIFLIMFFKRKRNKNDHRDDMVTNEHGWEPMTH